MQLTFPDNDALKLKEEKKSKINTRKFSGVATLSK